MDQIIYRKAFIAAIRVSFLETREEFDVYVNALYLAMIWAKTNNSSINEQNGR